MKPGLVSVTFRKLSVERIIELVGQAGLAGIEWGGDVHVPHGDVGRARQVGQWTRDAGLAVSAYGSYYCVGQPEPPFEKVLASAVELGAPLIRVWAGKMGSAKADEAHWRTVIDESRRIGESAGRAGVQIAFEYHANTLTDTAESAVRLLEQVNSPHVRTYWQPSVRPERPPPAQDLRAVLPWLAGLHVYVWRGQERLPLSAGRDDWAEYLRLAQGAGDIYALLEFVERDDPEAFLRDAATLKSWLHT